MAKAKKEVVEQTQDAPEEVPVLKVTDDDKKNFYKAFLSDKPFEDEFSLFDAEFVIRFRTLTVGESKFIFDQLKRDQQANELNSDAVYMLTLTNYRLAASILSINNIPYLPDYTLEKYVPLDKENASDNWLKVRAKTTDAWSVIKLSAIAEAFKDFEEKITQLARAIQEPNFWKAAK